MEYQALIVPKCHPELPSTQRAGTDPVAIDFLVAQVINQVRQQHGKETISNDDMKHIFTAAQMGLGQASEAQIEEVAVLV